MSTLSAKRNQRRWTSKARGDRRNIVTELENAQILIAWRSGDISFDQAAEALAMSLNDTHKLLLSSAKAGKALALEIIGARKYKKRLFTPQT